MSKPTAIRSIAVVGRDGDVWLSALLLQRSLGKGEQPVAVTLVELPSHTLPQDLVTTLPAQRLLYQLLGLPERSLLASSGGVPSLGYHYSGWGDGSSSHFQVYDSAGADLDGVPFIHRWSKARRRGLNVSLDEFSLAAAAARRRKMLCLDDQIHNFADGAFSGASSACNLSAPAYLKGIGRLALDAGVRHLVAEVEFTSIHDGNIQWVQLKGGQRVHADLFIDASGTGELIGKFAKDHCESWSQWFPCDRALVASLPRLHPLPAFNQVSALSSGWMGLYPLAARTAVLAPFHSHNASADQILQTAQRMAGGQLQQPQLRILNTGARAQPWQGNCVTVGSAAASLDPLQGLQMHMLHTSISYLLSLMPNNTDCGIERELYNSRLYSHTQRLRDYQFARYLLNRRPEPFWRTCAEAPVPQTLARKIDLFKARGNIPLEEHETFDEASWQALFASCGLIPDSHNSLADKIPEPEQIAHFQDMLRFVAAQAERMPDLESYMKATVVAR